MSDYKHRLTLAVPEQYMNEANNLALITGISAADINTFTSANWKDTEGNLYAVCSAAIKPVVLGMYGVRLSTIELPLHALEANVEAAQLALDKSVMYESDKGIKADPSKIIIAIDYEPLEFLEAVGLSSVESVEDV